jgi:selenocysteine lyase/cysteine desulfurase
MPNLQLQSFRDGEFAAVTAHSVYLNHAGVSPMPARVAAAVSETAAQFSRDPLSVFLSRVMPASASARARLARLLGVPAEHLALTKNTGHGLSIVADGLKLDAGDNVVSVDCEYPSVVYPWYAQKDRGIETRLVTPHADGTFTADDLDAVMDDRTRVVTVSWIQFGTGFRCDLAAITAAAHARDALVIVDVIQGLGALPLNVEALGIDIAVTGAHKWLMAPPGTGGLYVAPHVLDRLRLVNMGAGAVVDVMKFDPLDFSVKPTVQRYEEGSPNALGLVGLDAALSLLEEVGSDAIGTQVMALSAYAARKLDEKNYQVVSPRADGQRAGLVTFRHRTLPNESVLQTLADAGVVAAVRGGNLRFSPHFYNTMDEIDQAVDALPE